LLYLTWASTKVDTHPESARSNQSYRRCQAAYGKVEKNKNTLTRRTSQPIAWAGLGVGSSFGKVSAISGTFKLVAVLDSSSEISSSRPATLPHFFPLLRGFPPRQGAVEGDIRDKVSDGQLPLLERAHVIGSQSGGIPEKGSRDLESSHADTLKGLGRPPKTL